MPREERFEIINKIQEKRKSKLLCYLTSDRQNASAYIAKDILSIFSDHLSLNQYDKIDLLIFTLGGDVSAAFGLNRLLREYTDNLNAFIPDKCHSAGTLFSLGCNAIYMGKASSLGPIDPSINDPLNPTVEINGKAQKINLSVESLSGFKDLVRNEWNISENSHLMEILKSLTDKVHPLALGNIYRTNLQINTLAKTLLEQHRNDEENISNIVYKLTKGLGSHDYLIFRKEAQSILGDQIIIDEEINQLMRSLYKDFANEMELGRPFDPNLIISSIPRQPAPEGQIHLRKSEVLLTFAMVESADHGHKFIEKRILTEVPVPGNVPRIGVQEEVISKKWQSY